MAAKQSKKVPAPTWRRYDEVQKEQAVRMVRQLRVELGTSYGVAARVAEQLGFGPESVRSWVKDADIRDGLGEGASEAVQVDELKAQVRDLEQDNRELRRANVILKQASAFFAAELDRPHR